MNKKLIILLILTIMVIVATFISTYIITKKTKKHVLVEHKKTNFLIECFQELHRNDSNKKPGVYGLTSGNKYMKKSILVKFYNYIKNKNYNYIIINLGDGTCLHIVKNICSYGEINKADNNFEISNIFFDIKINKKNWDALIERIKKQY